MPAETMIFSPRSRLYTLRSLRAQISGVRPNLDYVEVFPRTEYKYIYQTETVSQKHKIVAPLSGKLRVVTAQEGAPVEFGLPLFFIENQSYFGIDNPHKNHNPRVSKMLITAHPKDGVEFAKKAGLPPIINNFILQHHGEGLAKYFYNCV